MLRSNLRAAGRLLRCARNDKIAATNPETFMFLRNCWYVAAWDHEVTRMNLLRRILLDEPVVFYRTEDGRPVALGRPLLPPPCAALARQAARRRARMPLSRLHV